MIIEAWLIMIIFKPQDRAKHKFITRLYNSFIWNWQYALYKLILSFSWLAFIDWVVGCGTELELNPWLRTSYSSWDWSILMIKFTDRLKRSVSVSGNNCVGIISTISRVIIFLNWWAEHDVSILSIMLTDDTDFFVQFLAEWWVMACFNFPFNSSFWKMPSAMVWISVSE